jgi:hypothetical protein
MFHHEGISQTYLNQSKKHSEGITSVVSQELQHIAIGFEKALAIIRLKCHDRIRTGLVRLLF